MLKLRNLLVVIVSFCLLLPSVLYGQVQPYVLEGNKRESQLLNQMHELHLPRAFSTCTLWDGWLPHATLWTSQQAQERYRNTLLTRRIDEQGYVSMQQHRGMAHSEGWPFPAWQQSTGAGFHFSTQGESWAVQAFGLKPLTSVKGWEISGAEVSEIDPVKGLVLQLHSNRVEIVTPEFQCGTIAAPFARLEWGVTSRAETIQARLQWQYHEESQWKEERFMDVPVPASGTGHHFANVPLHQHPQYGGLLKRYRLVIEQGEGTELQLKSLLTAIDTRHPITGGNYIQACYETFCWTGDVDFLRRVIAPMRKAMRFTLDEFQVRRHKHVVVNWVGHTGETGLTRNEEGTNSMRIGIGVGNNYWDLLPFGGHDGLATIYLYEALQKLAELEQAIANHPEWEIPAPEQELSSAALKHLASQVQTDFQQRFWNQNTKRFNGWIDRNGQAYDYGFTFVNLEAIHYGLASKNQAREIYDWLDGKRIVESDTSTGRDIYRWRFGPRSTTKRNVETYVWVWSRPESIPWGGQVQDGGAVMGFSYFDLMSRLKTHGADNAKKRLSEILDWFEEVQQEGGYRKYYAKPGRGTLQGGGTAGGLGFDYEFMESILLPQMMLDGFAGFRVTPEGYEIHPNLPADWKSLTIRNIHYRGGVYQLKIDSKSNKALLESMESAE